MTNEHTMTNNTTPLMFDEYNLLSPEQIESRREVELAILQLLSEGKLNFTTEHTQP